MDVASEQTSLAEKPLSDRPAYDRRRVTVVGSTGSIGVSTLDLVAREPDRFDLAALTAHRNVALLIEQARALRPELAVIADPALYDQLKDGLAGTGIKTAAGESGLWDAADWDADFVMAGIVGAAGLAPTLRAVRRGACVALANKECLVSAGPLFLAEVARSGATLLPVDSEHNAIFQVLASNRLSAVERIILTASGGPFRTASLEVMEKATPEQAVKHPRWDMGAKISVDSATLMNKGLELIEAHYLFPVGHERIDVVVHPESIVHSMVAYVDGSVLAQLGSPDMRTPIAHTLAWPERMATPCERLDLTAIGQLRFEKPNHEAFPALNLCRAALESGGFAPTALNAANEIAVAAFLERRIGFLDIARLVETVLSRLDNRLGALGDPADLEAVYEMDTEARREAEENIGRLG